ncbi:DMT family transporter [Methylocystis parvus]|uniref:DMT family transporter n=1 Tax=Methylocystis parvus TaxID=134 RepID=A0A6B8M5S3_9HYPH|nr:DMT family transporter [Methylocystis parvus]QGM96170.1 DMT family transporter [Methylocystis parvus]WBK00005.1 DMT family transporter [Methylocystis parvus OBBP]
MTRMRADLLLLLAAFIWGTAFIAQKYANDSMGPLSFVGARFLLSWIALAPLALYERGKAGCASLGKSDLGLAALIGFCLFAGAGLQQIGLVTTTATNGGFLTALYVILVPLIVWAITGARPRRIVLLAGVVSIFGAWLLAENGHLQKWTSGDALILIADIAWAAAISLVPIFLARCDRPYFLAFAQYGVVAFLGLVGGLGLESFSGEGLAAALPAILYAGLFSGGIAYTLQIVAQKYTPAAEAALIMSLESVFAALSGALLLSERLTPLALLGCGLILAGAILVEAEPALRSARMVVRRRRR